MKKLLISALVSALRQAGSSPMGKEIAPGVRPGPLVTGSRRGFAQLEGLAADR